MNDLALFGKNEDVSEIKVSENNGMQTISARELYEKLEVKHRFSEWFATIMKYGFVENEDFTSVRVRTLVNNGAERELDDYAITIEMAKQICMLQRSEKGKLYREYFLKIEKAWNTPEAIMARALQVANTTLENAKKQIAILIPKAEVYDQISDSATLQDLQTVAQTIGLKNVFKVLVADGIIELRMLNDGQTYYKPYARYSEYLVLKDGKGWKDDKGVTHIRPRVFVTGKGLVWLTRKYGA